MKDASKRVKGAQFNGEDPHVVEALRVVANTFVQLQQKRHIADYDNTTFWTRTDALTQVRSAEDAFNKWKPIRHEQIAQAYLVSLIVKKRD